jgi:heat shock protein HslJ
MMTRTMPAVILLLLLSACAGGAPSGDGSRLAGRAFLSTAVTGHSLVSGTQIQLDFPEEGKLTARAGCNHLFGEVTYEGDRMKVSGMGGTDMGCDQPRMDQDQWLTEFLMAGPKFALNGDDLVLTGDQVMVKLTDRKVAQPDRSLQGTRWVLESLVDGQVASSVPEGVEAFLEFEGEKVVGNGGCNGLGGQAVQGPGTVTFSSVFATKKSCGVPRDQVEIVVLAVLDGKVAVTVDGDVLHLKHANGKGLQLRSAGEPRPSTR